MKITGTVETAWRMKAWYLTTFGGRRVLSIHSRPVVNLGHSIVYRRSYVLIPDPKLAHEEQLSAA